MAEKVNSDTTLLRIVFRRTVGMGHRCVEVVANLDRFGGLNVMVYDDESEQNVNVWQGDNILEAEYRARLYLERVCQKGG